MQEMLGAHEPDYGDILDDMLVPDGGTVSIGRLLQPRVEIEIAFLLGRPIAGEAVALADVLAATTAVGSLGEKEEDQARGEQSAHHEPRLA
jgi:2-oxo-3-hexenedioate decarboxylase/2-keto-4-pentenoate hydratase